MVKVGKQDTFKKYYQLNIKNKISINKLLINYLPVYDLLLY